MLASNAQLELLQYTTQRLLRRHVVQSSTDHVRTTSFLRCHVAQDTSTVRQSLREENTVTGAAVGTSVCEGGCHFNRFIRVHSTCCAWKCSAIFSWILDSNTGPYSWYGGGELQLSSAGAESWLRCVWMWCRRPERRALADEFAVAVSFRNHCRDARHSKPLVENCGTICRLLLRLQLTEIKSYCLPKFLPVHLWVVVDVSVSLLTNLPGTLHTCMLYCTVPVLNWIVLYGAHVNVSTASATYSLRPTAVD